MKPTAHLINAARGPVVHESALALALREGWIAGAGLDVYEEEEGVLFEDHSEHVLQDDVLARLLTFPNVVVTAHQGFFTREAMPPKSPESSISSLMDLSREG